MIGFKQFVKLSEQEKRRLLGKRKFRKWKPATTANECLDLRHARLRSNFRPTTKQQLGMKKAPRLFSWCFIPGQYVTALTNVPLSFINAKKSLPCLTRLVQACRAVLPSKIFAGALLEHPGILESVRPVLVKKISPVKF